MADDDGNVALELETPYTKQDEERDLATLSIPEIMKLQGDLSGLTADLSGMTLCSSSSSPPLPSSLKSLLSSLDEEMRKLPSADTVAYHQAVSNCPDQVSPRRRMMFIECEENNVPLAARRLALHWRLRLDLFGPSRAFLPMTLSGAMQDEIEHIVKRPINQLLPETDASGRAIIYTVATRRNFAEYSVKQENRTLWYLLQLASENDQVRKSGFVGVTDGRNVERKHFSKKLAADREELLCQAQPIPFRSLHLLYPSLLAHYFILPIVKNLIRRNTRFRMISHYGSQSEVLRELEEDYRLPSSCLPTDIGGVVHVNVMKWVQERFALETSRANQRMHVQDAPSIPPLFNAAAAARSDDTNGATMKATAKKKKKGKRGGNRGKADPRMDRAVGAREANPDMTPYDALLFGGFVFTKVEGSNEMVDADNISLKQRRNQLARRMRHNAARRKEAEAEEEAAATDEADEQGKVHEPPQPSDVVVTKTMATTRAHHYYQEAASTTCTSTTAANASNANGMIDGTCSIPAAATGTCTDVINTVAAFACTVTSEGMQHAQYVQQQQQVSHVPVKRRHSADSFDDEINALPGIGDVVLAENDDDDLASCDSLFGNDNDDDGDDDTCRGGV